MPRLRPSRFEGAPPAREDRPRVGLSCPSEALAVVDLIGEHDLGQFEMLGKALQLAAAQRRNVLVDMTQCDFIDSTVVSLLLAAHVEVSSGGGEFAVVIPPDPSPVARTAEIMGLAEMFPTYSSREDAEATEHVVLVRDLRARFGDPESFAAECSCGWRGKPRSGENAERAARREARMHADARAARVRNGPSVGR